MESLERIYDKIRDFSLEKNQEKYVLDKIDSIKSHILDVITYSKEYDDIKENVPFPALFDKDNGVLYAYQTLYKNKPCFLMLIWKNGVLDVDILNISINAKAFSNKIENLVENDTIAIPEEKESISTEEILQGIPEEKESVSTEEILQGIPEEKESVSTEEILQGIPEEKE